MTIFEDFVVQGQGLLVVNWSSSTRTFLKDNNTGYIMGVPPLQQFDFLPLFNSLTSSGSATGLVISMLLSPLYIAPKYIRHSNFLVTCSR